MTKTNDTVNLKAGQDRTLVHGGSSTYRFVLAELKAPKIEQKVNERRPINLAVVIDASGSMSGEPIEAAKRAAEGVVEQMTDGDFLSVVSFDSDVRTHINRVKIDDHTRTQARAAIRQLRAGSMTNLSGGWLQGAELAARVMEEQNGFINRVLLLSDGHANQGECDPKELRKIASNLFERGIISSCVGIGHGFSNTQLRAIADHGGGRLHHAERPEEIIETVLGEFGELRQMYSESTILTLLHPEDMKAEALGDYPTDTKSDCLTVRLGSLLSGASRDVAFKLVVSGGELGQKIKVFLRGTFKRPGEADTVKMEPVEFDYTVASDDDVNDEKPDERVVLRVAELWQDSLAQESVELNRRGRRLEVRSRLEQNRRVMHDLTLNVEDAAPLMADMDAMLDTFSAEMDEVSRKQVEHAAYSSSRAMKDVRSTPSLPFWKDALKRGDGNAHRTDPVQSETYPLHLVDGVMFAEIGPVRALIDTGAPVSLGAMDQLVLNGRRYRLSDNYLGADMRGIQRYVPTNVDALIGCDILKDFTVTFDLPGGELRLDLLSSTMQGSAQPIDLVLGIVPVMQVVVNGARRSLIFDSGAHLSYLDRRLVQGVLPDGEMEDFYPGIGRFRTDLFHADVELAGISRTYHFGVLPGVLAPLLGMTGAEGILGISVLRDFLMTLKLSEHLITVHQGAHRHKETR